MHSEPEVDKLRQPELDSLLGAWALNAVDDDERRHIGDYLAGAADARREAERLRKAAEVLQLLEPPSSHD